MLPGADAVGVSVDHVTDGDGLGLGLTRDGGGLDGDGDGLGEDGLGERLVCRGDGDGLGRAYLGDGVGLAAGVAAAVVDAGVGRTWK